MELEQHKARTRYTGNKFLDMAAKLAAEHQTAKPAASDESKTRPDAPAEQPPADKTPKPGRRRNPKK